jgi:hypothetical protein
MVEAYVKISRTGLLCLALLWTPALVSAQAPPDAAATPADQQSAPQAPAQQAPAPPPQQPQPPQQPSAETPPQLETQRLKLPPPPPKVVDVRLPGEAGYYVGITGWLPIGQIFTDKGHAASFTDPSKLQLAGKAQASPGVEIGIAAGLHNSIRVSYFSTKRSGTTTAANEMVVFSQTYAQGDQLSTNGKLTDYKLSYEYLSWPYPVEARHFRLKTLYQVQYISVKTTFDAPVRSATPDSAGNFTSFSALGSKGYITPALGLGFHEYATRSFRLEANVSGFMLPHRWQLLDSDATIAYRAGHLELRAGAKAFLFRTSPKSDYFFRGTVGGVMVGLRWYSD